MNLLDKYDKQTKQGAKKAKSFAWFKVIVTVIILIVAVIHFKYTIGLILFILSAGLPYVIFWGFVDAIKDNNKDK